MRKFSKCPFQAATRQLIYLQTMTGMKFDALSFRVEEFEKETLEIKDFILPEIDLLA